MSTGYKLFEQDAQGRLFPLFIGKNEETPMNQWIHAEYLPTKGFASRGGWHIGATVPDAPWLKSYDGTETGYYKPRWKHGKRVWCEVEYNDNHNYNSYVQTLPKKCITDGVPEDGFYDFREVGKGVWIITSDIRVVRILSEEERQEIMVRNNYSEVGAFRKYKETFEKRMSHK